jgi:hypothetical protein
MLSIQSSDPSWTECFRRIGVPFYEEARPFIARAASDGWDPTPAKLSPEKLVAITKAFGQ